MNLFTRVKDLCRSQTSAAGRLGTFANSTRRSHSTDAISVHVQDKTTREIIDWDPRLDSDALDKIGLRLSDFYLI
jgi:hypothetical protein